MPSATKPERVGAEMARLLRASRERQGLSMTSVAERAGLSQQMVSFVERGLRKPTLDTLLRITEALAENLPAMLAQAISDATIPPAARRR